VGDFAPGWASAGVAAGWAAAAPSSPRVARHCTDPVCLPAQAPSCAEHLFLCRYAHYAASPPLGILNRMLCYWQGIIRRVCDKSQLLTWQWAAGSAGVACRQLGGL
jgi:hypothetical protein